MTMELNESQKNDLAEFQAVQQQVQQLAMQKQQFQFASAELDRAISAVGASGGEKLYRFSGSILVPATAEKLKVELAGEKDMIKLRTESVAKVEDKLKAKLLDIQKRFESVKPAGQKRAN